MLLDFFAPVIIIPYTSYHLYNIHYYDVKVKYKKGLDKTKKVCIIEYVTLLMN